MSELAPVMVLDADSGPQLQILVGDGSVRGAIWPGTGAQLRSMHHLQLHEGAHTIELRHDSDAAYAVLSGQGTVFEPPASEPSALREGSMFHVDAGTAYVISAGAGGIELVGGPAPADPALYGEVQ